jgi:transposase InsO family protein
VERDFSAAAPNQLWLVDFTYSAQPVGAESFGLKPGEVRWALAYDTSARAA